MLCVNINISILRSITLFEKNKFVVSIVIANCFDLPWISRSSSNHSITFACAAIYLFLVWTKCYLFESIYFFINHVGPFWYALILFYKAIVYFNSRLYIGEVLERSNFDSCESTRFSPVYEFELVQRTKWTVVRIRFHHD